MGDEHLSMAVPLDSDGFLRRECPTCEREFKWRPSPEDEEAQPPPEGGYFCPYCAVQAPINSWWTKQQVTTMKSRVFDEVIRPEMDKLADAAASTSGDFLQVSVEVTGPEKAPPLTESDDMRRVDFTCHPGEPVKVLDDWTQMVHCLLCGLTQR
jgi:hypothetical protein